MSQKHRTWFSWQSSASIDYAVCWKALFLRHTVPFFKTKSRTNLKGSSSTCFSGWLSSVCTSSQYQTLQYHNHRESSFPTENSLLLVRPGSVWIMLVLMALCMVLLSVFADSVGLSEHFVRRDQRKVSKQTLLLKLLYVRLYESKMASS